MRRSETYLPLVSSLTLAAAACSHVVPGLETAVSMSEKEPAIAEPDAATKAKEKQRREEELARFIVHYRTQKWTDSRCVVVEALFTNT